MHTIHCGGMLFTCAGMSPLPSTKPPCALPMSPQGARLRCAWGPAAMTDRTHREQLADVLAEIRADLGRASDQETAWARSVLGR